MPNLQMVPWSKQIAGIDKTWASAIDAGVMANYGVSVVLYNQGRDPRCRSGGEHVSGGFCLGVSIMWIVKTARGESFWDWFQPPSEACPNLKNKHQKALWNPILPLLREIMRMESQRKKLSDQFTATGGTLDIATFMQIQSWWAPKISHDSAAQRHPAGEGLLTNILDGAALADLILKSKSGYKVISISGVGGAHAMAARVVDGTVVFMDPNNGEFYFPSREHFKKFFTSFWKNRYSKFGEVVYVNAFTDPEVIKYG